MLEEYELLNEELEKKNEELVKENERLNSIIKEAIDYIEIIQYNESYGVKEKDYLNLLDILKGADKE